MAKCFHPLLAILVQATESEMAQMLDYLKTENRLLRAKLPKRVTVTAGEKEELVKRGKSLSKKIKELVTIVSPRTFAKWASGETKKESKPIAGPAGKGGRPRKPEELRELILQMAKDCGWGMGRIMSELKKLGVRKLAKGTVRNILIENGFDPDPKRGEGTWSEFIKMHAETLWACDFFSKKVWTMGGLIEYFVLFFIQPGTRRVHIAGVTGNPDDFWMAQQARNLCIFLAEQPQKAKYIVCDRDTKFTEQFEAILKTEDIELKRVGYRAPNQNAYAERFVQMIKAEALDHFVVFGENHLRYLIREYVDYYHNSRPHSGLDHLPPLLMKPPDPVESLGINDVVCHERLGGLLKWYERKAA